ncbi:MoxR family ATPase [Kutzneria viridogrisea]|uniref:AAA ATPase n=2 Tax=Kutzneria TaxID=43356 RepID=W5W6E4_9PSEU|nr:MoxR family ATPase [Kutzneria albida]AHH96335.1 AAA ATPase [Kutzneria albida DSM 43870]MBA8928449.1 MoxR-like ATPase [Kutzneria viridogrisea]
MTGDQDWLIYRGTGEPHDGIKRLPPPPRWREFGGGPLVDPVLGADSSGGRRLGERERAASYRADPEVVEIVNAALYLRRPLLVTGKPGTGKSTLAYSIAHELGLGPVLRWPITSRSTLEQGLYRYDAIGRLQDASLRQNGARTILRQVGGGDASPPSIGRYVRLGKLGTAMLPQRRPRVLLIDEIDKSDVDLPNDLLNVFEEGEFEIPELTRLPDDQSVVEVMIADGTDQVAVHRGRVRCNAFPVVVLTSNGERDFPPAFLRRCLRIDIRTPNREQLTEIVAAHLGEHTVAECAEVIDRFLDDRRTGDLANDQLLNAIYLATSGGRPQEETRGRLLDALLRPLNQQGS